MMTGVSQDETSWSIYSVIPWFV